MGTYYIPRNYRGESRILYIFTVKSLITTAIGGMLGMLFFVLFKAMNLTMVGVIIMAFFALIGYIPITKKIGGEPVGEIIMRYIKFKESRKIYTYVDTKEEK